MSNDPPKKTDRPPTPPQPPMRMGRSMMAWIAVIVLLGVAVLMMNSDQATEIPAYDFWQYAKNGKIVNSKEKGEKLVIYDREIRGALLDGTIEKEKDGEPDKFVVIYAFSAEEDFDQRLQAALRQGSETVNQGTLTYEYAKPSWWQDLLPQLLVMVLVIAALWFFVFRRIGSAGGGGGFLGNFGRSRHRLINKEQSRITFSDVAGIQEAKDEVREIIEFLKNPHKFQRLGGRIPRGVLLVGEPGCGKTLLAKAIAGEAEVPFFSISGSDFVEMFVGVGASRVRDLFKQAKESAPCIIFLDEIDAVGRRRGHGMVSGGHDEREQTLNAILVEMDGFDTSDQVIVIAATNRMDVLDPALTRPGRFDRQIEVPLPDLQGRAEILRIYIAKITVAPDVDLNRLARGTPMFSGADLEALVNEAAIAATMSGKEFVEQEDLEEARDKVRWGRQQKNRAIDEKEREITAYHEAGHALTQTLLPDADPLHKVSIIPRRGMGGATFSLPEKDRYLYSMKYCKATLQVLFAGRIAEEMFCGDITSGAQSDIAQATHLARKMVLDWGMSQKLGTVNYASDDENNYSGLVPPGSKYSQATAEDVDHEIRALIDEAGTNTRTLLQESREQMESVARALIKYETLSASDVRDIIDGKTLDKPTVNDLLAAENLNPPAPGVTHTPPLPDVPDGTVPEAT